MVFLPVVGGRFDHRILAYDAQYDLAKNAPGAQVLGGRFTFDSH